jgi:hypothetical protein
MSRRPAVAKSLFIALAFLALVTALPLAAADHSYSHRYIVYGRVVDAENNPVPGLTVDIGTEKPFNPEPGGCSNQPGTETEAFGPTRSQPITNDFGEFIFCYHHHAMSRTAPGSAILRIASLNIEKNLELDGFMRYSFVSVKLDDVQATSNKTANVDSYTVTGRAWRSSGGQSISVDTVRVHGYTAHNKPVNVTLTYNGKEPITVTTVTNNYGDFAIRIPTSERATTGTVSMVIENQTFTQTLAPEGVTHFRAELSKVNDPFVTKFLIGLGIVTVAVVGGGGLWFASNRMRASREGKLIREQSQRKRSNK